MAIDKKTNKYGDNLSNLDIDELTKDLNRQQLIDMIKQYNKEINALHESIEHWEYLACCDAMTTGSMNDSEEFDSCDRKIYSRTYWEEIFKPVNQNLEGDCYLIDLNDLKKTNDTKGHEIGDKLICESAKFLCKYGMVIRLGGDEFFLVIDKRKENSFKKALAKYETRLPFAYGFYHKKATDSFSYVMRKTDNHMYEMKKNMKTNKLENKNN